MYKRMNCFGRVVAMAVVCVGAVSMPAVALVTPSAGGEFTQLTTNDGLAVTIYDDIDGNLVGAQVSYYDGKSLLTGHSGTASIVATDKTMVVTYTNGEIVACLNAKTGDFEWCAGPTGTPAASPPGCNVDVAISANQIVVVVQCGGRAIRVLMFCRTGSPPVWEQCGDFGIPTTP